MALVMKHIFEHKLQVFRIVSTVYELRFSNYVLFACFFFFASIRSFSCLLFFLKTPLLFFLVLLWLDSLPSVFSLLLWRLTIVIATLFDSVHFVRSYKVIAIFFMLIVTVSNFLYYSSSTLKQNFEGLFNSIL